MLNFKKQLNLEEQKKDINNLLNLKERFIEIQTFFHFSHFFLNFWSVECQWNKDQKLQRKKYREK